MASKNLKQKAASGMIWAALQKYSTMLIQFVSCIILAHLLTPYDYGCIGMLMIPLKDVSSPALVIELKYDKSTQAAICQTKARYYPQTVADYTGDILLVGINYDKDTKQHDCR